MKDTGVPTLLSRHGSRAFWPGPERGHFYACLQSMMASGNHKMRPQQLKISILCLEHRK